MDAADSLMAAFQQASNQWVGPLQQVATWLLISLATISLVWKFGLLALQQADFQEFVVELLRMILFVGFFLAVIQYADVWSRALIDGFAWLANHVTGSGSTFNPTSITPASVLHLGMSLSLTITEAATGWSSTITYVTAAGIILLGFGGNQWTNDYATRYLTYCISVGMKLFVTLLIVGLGEQLIYNWALAVGDWGNFGNVLSVTGVLLLLVVLVWMLPNIIQGVVNGSSLGSGAGSFGAVAGLAGGAAIGAGVAATGMVKSTAAGATAVMEAAKLAHSQVGSGIAGMGVSIAAQTAKNLGHAAAESMGSSLRDNSKLAQAIHAARLEAEQTAALQDAGGGSGASPKKLASLQETALPTDPLGDHLADMRAMAAEDQREPSPLDFYREI